MSTTTIVPFGKYKGQPVEMLAADRAYCEWLQSQDWFRTKFVGIHTVIVNHFGAPAETPEHNALQARFLEEDWCQRFALCNEFKAYADAKRNRLLTEARTWVAELATRAQNSIDVVNRIREREENPNPGVLSYYEKEALVAQRRHAIANEELQRIPMVGWSFDATAECEVRGIDVVLDVSLCSHDRFAAQTRSVEQPGQYWLERKYNIECKPTLGDDYPAVLRQMKANESGYLVIGECRTTAVTYEQVCDIFERSDMTVNTVTEIEAQSLVWNVPSEEAPHA